ncbi:hypothetical protein KAM334_02690 [Aeromonas caviae]|nr:hypothetical protein KAM334_02690 [Aeromonas caviae]
MQPVAVGTDDGLVDGGQLGGLDGEWQLGGDELAAFELGIECGVEQGTVLLLALALGQGGLGVAQQTLGILGLAMGYAEEHRDLDPVLLDLIGRHQLLLQVAAPRIQREGELGQQQGEVIRRDPTEQGLGRRQSLQAAGHLAQQAVGDPYAEAIVDLAKMLQIHQQQAGLAGPQMTAGLQEVGELEQAGQAVVVLLLLQLGLGGAQPGDVAAKGKDAEGVALVIRHLDPGDLQMAASALGIHHAILPLTQGLFDGQPGRDAPTQSLACHQPHEVEKGLVAVDEHALMILETDEVGNGIQQAALQQLLLAEGLLQLLALIDGADHGKQGDGVAVLVIQGNLVDLHPAGAFAAVAMELLVQQGFAVGQQAVIFLPEYIPPGHLGIALANEFARVLQAGFPGECLVGKQVPSVLVPAEDIHG